MSARASLRSATAASRLPLLVAVVVSLALVVLIALTTPTLDWQVYHWDNVIYRDMANNHFHGHFRYAPWEYRFATPFLADLIRRASGHSLLLGFRVLAWIGTVAELVGVFALTRRLTRSLLGAYFALLVCGLSAFTVKFLLFDPTRPDDLGFALVLLAAWLALDRRVGWLCLVTLVGVCFREFVALPLGAYLVVILVRRQWRAERRALAAGLLTGVACVALPRLLIPTTQSNVNVTWKPGFLFGGPHLINTGVSLLAFVVPLAMVAGPARLRAAWHSLPAGARDLLAAYTVLTVLATVLGGGDTNRFAAYLFLPLAVLLAAMSRMLHRVELVVVVVATAVYNRTFWPIPLSTKREYVDFYAAWNTLVDAATLHRVLEALAWIALGVALHALFRWTRLLPPHEAAARARRLAVERTSGAYADAFPHDHLRTLRQEWPD